MPMTPTLNVDPTVMTNNWSQGLSNPVNQAKLVYGYTHPDRAFNADPAGAEAAWQAGITRAQSVHKYSNNLGAADVNKAADNMAQFGGANWSSAGTSKKYKYAAKAPALAQAINTVKASIAQMPKGRGQANINRAVAWMQQMGAYYGKI